MRRYLWFRACLGTFGLQDLGENLMRLTLTTFSHPDGSSHVLWPSVPLVELFELATGFKPQVEGCADRADHLSLMFELATTHKGSQSARPIYVHTVQERFLSRTHSCHPLLERGTGCRRKKASTALPKDCRTLTQ